MKKNIYQWMTFIMATIVSTVFFSCGGDDEENPTNKQLMPSDARAVDLGLSVHWAKMNVGASSPEDIRLYFAWGETKGYTSNTSDGHQARLFRIQMDDAWTIFTVLDKQVSSSR